MYLAELVGYVRQISILILPWVQVKDGRDSDDCEVDGEEKDKSK